MDAAMFYKRGDHNYMIRSEKRPGLTGRPPRGKKPKGHWLYKLLTILLLIICCPAGLVMLWRRRPITWHATQKFLISICSLILCFVLLSVSLLYDFKDPTLQKAQQRVLLALDSVWEAGERVGKGISDWTAKIAGNWTDVIDNAPEIAGVAGNQAVGLLLDKVATPSPEPTATPEPTDTPKPTATPVPPLSERVLQADFSRRLIERSLPTDEPTDTPTDEPTDAPTDAPTDEPTDAPTDEPTDAPTDAPSVVNPAETLSRPTPTSDTTPYAPTETPSTSDMTSATVTATVTVSLTPTNSPTPSLAPTMTPEPTIDPALIPPLRAAGDIVVWHTTNGKWYHAKSVCGTMSNAKQYTLESCAKARMPACPYCNPVSTSAMSIDNAVYADADGYWHTNFDCESIASDWTVKSLDEMLGEPTLKPCDACGAIYYTDGMPALTAADVITPGETGAANLSAITNGNDLVYVSERNASYHRFSTCSGALGLTLSPGHLADALLDGKTRCEICQPVEPELSETP